jgi:prohibitin 1
MNIASVLQGLATFSWLVVVGIIILAVIRASRARPLKGAVSIVIGTVIFALVLTTVSAGLVFLQADQYGVVISAIQPNGYRAQPLAPGLHWVVPFVENVKPYSIAKATYTMATTWQGRYEDNLVRPVVRSAIRDAVSQFGVEEIVSTKRAELENLITDQIEAGLKANNLILDDFLLRNIRFSDEYAKAVEQKQIAEQQALQAQFVVQQKKQEAEQVRQTAQGAADAVVIAANGEAQSIEIKAKAQAAAWAALAAVLKDHPEMLTYEYIQKIAPNLQVIYLPSGTPLLLPSTDPTASAPPAIPTAPTTPTTPTTPNP